MNEFNPEMMILARESRGLTQSALAKLVSIKQGTISKIESGMLPISDEALEQIATTLEYPTQFFFQQDRVYGFGSSVFYHRKRRGLPISVLRKLHAQSNIRRMHISRLLRATELDSRRGFECMDPEDYQGDIERIAQLVRAMWRLPHGPVRNVTDTIENNGGIVIRCDFGTRKIDAISEWTDLCPPLFFVNSHPDITADRVRRSLAHEIGHIIMHKYPTDTMEEESDRFAAEFLTPAREIKPLLYGLRLPKLAALKREWKVSMGSLIEQAFKLGTITPYQRQYLIINMKKRTHSFREPPETDFPIEKPRVLDELVQTHMRTLGYSPQELSCFLGELETNFRTLYLPAPKVVKFA